MPLYAGVSGAQKKIEGLYAGISGASEEIDFLYGGVGGMAKEIFTSYRRWKKYKLTTAASIVYEKSGSAVFYREDAYTHYFYAKSTEADLISSYDTDREMIKFEAGDEYQALYLGASTTLVDQTTGYYFAVEAALDELQYYHSNYGVFDVTRYASRFLKFNGETEFVASGNEDWSGDKTTLYGDFYKLEVVDAKGDYIETVQSKDISAYPVNGAQDGYWYVYDGEITWSKYTINEIYEPSSYNSAESFSASSLSYPILMAEQAKKDSNGNVDWGTTYSASSAANIRNNYSTYPYSSFKSTLTADTLYKITTASILSYKRKLVSGWGKTDEKAGTYIGDVMGKYGDYPEDGAQDGYWYIMNEIT